MGKYHSSSYIAVGNMYFDQRSGTFPKVVLVNGTTAIRFSFQNKEVDKIHVTNN